VRESLPWLLQNSKTEEAVKLLKHISKINNKTLDDSELLLCEKEELKVCMLCINENIAFTKICIFYPTTNL